MPKKEPKLPLFLREHRAPALKSLAYYAALMTNWLVIHGHIRELPATHSSLNVLRCMLIAEYYRATGARMQIVVRLHGRYNILRNEMERAELNAG